jgi:putative flippase GtrA
VASRIKRAYQFLYDRLIRYVLKFGIVGLAGYFVDFGISNALWLGFLGKDNFFHSSLGAKVVSVSIATLVTWFGNRYWTFREHRRENFLLELLEFSTIAVIGMGISLLCLFFSEYVLGFTSLLAKNISGNVIGLVIATAFRFLLYRFWVYGHNRSDGLTARKRRAAETAQTLEAASALETAPVSEQN